MKIVITQAPAWTNNKFNNKKDILALGMTWNDKESYLNYKSIAEILNIKSGHLYALAEQCKCIKYHDMIISNDKTNLDNLYNKLEPFILAMAIVELSN